MSARAERLHPLYFALLKQFANESGLDVEELRKWTDLEAPAPPGLAALLEKALGVPRSSWWLELDNDAVRITSNKPPRRKRGAKVVGPFTPSYTPAVPQTQRDDRIQKGLDQLGWTVQQLTEGINKYLKSQKQPTIGRSQVQFYKMGSRTAGRKGNYYPLKQSAPEIVRKAAEHATGGVIKPKDWP